MSRARAGGRGVLRCLRLGAWVGLGVAAVLAVAVILPTAAGWRARTVMSGSMTPTIATGDVVVVRPIKASQLRIGTVVTFRDPENSARLITHRLRQLRRTGSTITATTRGDANTGYEQWQVRSDSTVGLVVYRIPRVGYLLHTAGTPTGRLSLVAVPAFLWGILTLIGVWREPERRRPSTAVACRRPSDMLMERAVLSSTASRRPLLTTAAPLLALPPGPRRLELLPGTQARPAPLDIECLSYASL